MQKTGFEILITLLKKHVSVCCCITAA